MMLSARFRMAMPEELWTTELSTAYPETRFRVLAGVPTDDGAMVLGELVGGSPTAAAEAMQRHPAIVEYDELYSDGQRRIILYKGTQKIMFDFFGESSVPPEFPLVAENGVVEFDVTVTREQFDRLGETLDRRGAEYELVSVVTDRDSESILTDRQRECLSVALREGYFRVPRACTLEAVADSIGVDKSTASKTIRRGVARMLEWFLIEQESRNMPQSANRF